MKTSKTPAKIAILISGRGSNMLALAEAIEKPDFPAEVVLVLSDTWTAPGLEAARQRDIPICICSKEEFSERNLHEAAVNAALERCDADFICLAGYMRVLSSDFVEKWRGRLINIHPSLLPEFKGLDTHRRALEAGADRHGCTVHFVTAELDGGPIIAQRDVPILPGDSEEILAARVLTVEHELYPVALLKVVNGTVSLPA